MANVATKSQAKSTADLVWSIVLYLLLLAYCGYALFMGFFVSMSVIACTTNCNNTLGGSATIAWAVGVFVVLAVSLILMLRRRHRKMNMWWIPLAGIGAIFVLSWICATLIGVAYGTPIIGGANAKAGRDHF